MVVRHRFRRRHPVLGAAMGATCTTAVVGALFLVAGGQPAPRPVPPLASGVQHQVPAPSRETLLTVEVYLGAARMATAEGAAVTTLLSGTLPAVPETATVLTDACTTGGGGVESCTHALQLPGGGVLQVRHAHPVVTSSCPEVGDVVVVLPR